MKKINIKRSYTERQYIKRFLSHRLFIVVLPIIVCMLSLMGCSGEVDINADGEYMISGSGEIVSDSESAKIPEEATQEKTIQKETANGEMTQEKIIPDTENDIDTEHSFLGTVTEETTTYMIVEPDADEEERETADRIKIDYGRDHVDYLYGEGRRVVIYYRGDILQEQEMAVIKTEDISTEGFREFELSVVPSENNEKIKILNNSEIQGEDFDYDLYYYGLDEVNITSDNRTMSLYDALVSGRITLDGIIAKANEDVRNGVIEELVYRDGGSQAYRYDGYTIIKCHTADGNRDVYIGTDDMQDKFSDASAINYMYMD